MKQGITNEQFLSLTFEQSLRLMEIMGYPQEDASEEFYNNNKHIIARRFSYIIEKINIGKMIEMLSNSDFCFPSIGLTESRDRAELIVVGITCRSGAEKFRGKTYEANEICDALWEAVKAVI